MTKHSRTISHLSLAALALALASAAGSASAAVASATTTSTVVAPITITKAADLSFGSFAAAATTGTVTLSPNNARAFTGGVVGFGGAGTAAKFDVAGQAGQTYSISLGGTAVLTSGSDTMAYTAISDVTASAITTGTVASGTLTGGTQSIYVGGSLAVGANQAPGTYTGTLTATVNYN